MGGFSCKDRIGALTPACEPRGRSCGCAGTARHIGLQIAQPRPAGARSRGRSSLAAAYPGASVSAYRWPSYRSAACQAAACPAVFQGLGGITMPPQADNPRLDPDFLGYRPRAAPRPPATKLSAPAPNRAAMSPVSGSMPQAACDLSSKAGIIPMLNHDSRFMKSGY
jgi:hypothetical protein